MTSEKKFYLTKKGLERFKKEHQALQKLRLLKVRGEAPKTWQSEDLNPEYLSFQEDLNFFESRNAELENILKNAELIKPPSKERQNIVDLGATVTLEELDNGSLNEFMVVGTLEANPGEGKISSESPVGRVLLGRRVGDEIAITSPIKVIYKIKRIKYQIG